MGATKKRGPPMGNNSTYTIPIAALTLAMGYKMIFRLRDNFQKNVAKIYLRHQKT